MGIRQIGAILFSLLTFGSASAEIVTLEMLGYISGKPAPFVGIGVAVNDTFRLVVSYDAAPTSTQVQNIGGNGLYTLKTYDISFRLMDWTGSLPDEIRQYNADFVDAGRMAVGPGMTEWQRPPPTIDHREWSITSSSFSGNDDSRGFSLYLVTDYSGYVGYGWWAIGGQAYNTSYVGDVDFGFLNLTAINRVELATVPEPNTLVLLGISLALAGLGRRKRA